MTEEDKKRLLTITDYKKFEDELYSINEEYRNSFNLWDEELLEYYNHLLGLALRDNEYVQSEVITDVTVKLG